MFVGQHKEFKVKTCHSHLVSAKTGSKNVSKLRACMTGDVLSQAGQTTVANV